MTEREISDVPEGEVAQIKKMFEHAGCEVQTWKQPDGLYTVHADCPDEDENPEE